ncbi:hypothetical protein BTUL_0020g00720 [Botrytis tulipae]|uniref:Uncharacterized protein n=1 Tax=Botrytis tulipae TaxID=87230 RepID=A0A4Z1EY17_9HELO|nr:hypothetical protein BTUL_0020g00720 [Botrytis tulipae]
MTYKSVWAIVTSEASKSVIGLDESGFGGLITLYIGKHNSNGGFRHRVQLSLETSTTSPFEIGTVLQFLLDITASEL